MAVLSILRLSYFWYQTHKEPFEVLALALTFLGIVFAVQSVSDGRKMTRDLRSVFDHLTTRGLGPYPSYVPEVERLIAEARDSVLICCAFPGTGLWEDRGRYSAYLQALEHRKADRVRRSQNFSVRVVCLDGERRAQELEAQFPEASWRDYLKKGGFARSRRLYEELENCAVPQDRAEFIAHLLTRQERALSADLRFAECREVSVPLPIHFWIADEDRAVFVIPGAGSGGDYGFVTEEVGLVQGLLSIWRRYHLGAQVPATLALPFEAVRKRA